MSELDDLKKRVAELEKAAKAPRAIRARGPCRDVIYTEGMQWTEPLC